MSELNKVRNAYLEAGVTSLRAYGYPDVNKDNILTDFVYRQFFRTMLSDGFEETAVTEYRDVILSLIEEIDANAKEN